LSKNGKNLAKNRKNILTKTKVQLHRQVLNMNNNYLPQITDKKGSIRN